MASGSSAPPGTSRRRDGRALVIQELTDHGAASRADLARATGLAPSTVTAVVTELISDGLVSPAESTDNGGVGRPAQRVSLVRRAGVVVGIDLGRRHLKVAVADLSHSLLSRTEVATSADHDAREDLRLIGEQFAAALEVAGVALSEVRAVGMGLPGPVHTSGELGDSTILPGWVGVRAAQAVSATLGMPVRVDNDANLGALGEHRWGEGASAQDLMYLKVATGIGAGLVINGQLYRGVGGTAGEIGHTVVDPGGPVCRCGNRGCLEMYAGAAAILGALKPSRPDIGRLADVVAAAVAGDAGCRRVVGDAGHAVGSALATVCNILNPAQVRVGGTLGDAGELLLEPMRTAVSAGAVRSAAREVRILGASLGRDAELMGAVALALSGVQVDG